MCYSIGFNTKINTVEGLYKKCVDEENKFDFKDLLHLLIVTKAASPLFLQLFLGTFNKAAVDDLSVLGGR